MRFPFFRNRDSVKNGILISIRRTGDGFHPGLFNLALSQNSIPIIIDQPEDNLDNQSVYNKLVPCICAAKQKRQVIIVTHNPNIAVACDAEQIICCKMDKNTHKITYLSGAIEDQEIKQNVVDILEGTMPAFDLRRRKYV